MKRILAGTALSAILILLGARVSFAQDKSFTGIITDEKLNCLEKPYKGPDSLKSPNPNAGGGRGGRGGGAQGAEQGGEIQKTACVLYWAHSANPKDKIVLYDPDTKTTYQLDKEDLVLPYVGDTAKVTVIGTYDAAKKTINVKDVKS